MTPFKRSMIIIKEYAEKNKIESLKQMWKTLEKDLHWKRCSSMISALNKLRHVECVKEALLSIEGSMNGHN